MKYLLTAAMAAAALVVCTNGYAQNSMMGPSHNMGRMESVLCPTDVKTMVTPSPAAAGWDYSKATAPMHLDPANPPHVDPTILVCYYVFVSGNNAFDYSQPLAGRTCKTNSTKTGFDCH